jgi:catechol 2,3-dioxygenase-like lactoylglutathione lyase family enzyme
VWTVTGRRDIGSAAEEVVVAVALNHTIIGSRDPESSARWYAEVLGLEPPVRADPFWQVSTANGVNLDFDQHASSVPVHAQHYAFLISEHEFDEIFGRVVERGIDFYADPFARHKGEINHHDGGRGTYFFDPDGHLLEIITRPYGWSGD